MEFWRRKKEKGKARKCFVKNGSMFLEQLIADCNGISNPIRMFSSNQISKATNHFDSNCLLPLTSSWSILYRGVVEGRSYMIKIFTEPVVGDEERAYNDIALSARVSNHSGLTYLHIAFPRIIIHRDVKATHVFLDKKGTAKLTDFSLAVTLPEGKSWIEELAFGTYGHADPTYVLTGKLTEYSDVYSFGIFMLVLLLGRPALLDDSDGHLDFDTSILEHVKGLQERGEPVEFGGDSKDMRPGQMKMFLDLALRCCEERHEDRPKMILVAKEIKLIGQASL